MGKKAEPTLEEIQWMFRQLVRGLDDSEIKEERKDTEYPVRDDSRYYRRIRKYFLAAVNVLGTAATARDPLRVEKRREHEIFLVSGLEALRSPLLVSDLPNDSDWSSGEPRIRAREELISVPSWPVTLSARCLRDHLAEEDPVLVRYDNSRQLVSRFRQLCGTLYRELVGEARNVATEVGASLLPIRTGRGATLERGFVESLYRIAGHLAFRCLDDDNVQYSTRLCGDGLYDLCFGNTLMFIGGADQREMVKAAHEGRHHLLKQHSLVEQIRQAREEHDSLVCKVNQTIEIKAHQRVFLPGPCEICAPWGGLG